MDESLRALERKAWLTRDPSDVEAYARALIRLGTTYLQQALGMGSDWWQNLMYRHALKNVGGGNAGLDTSLPHTWSVVGSGNINYGAARLQLVQECRDDPQTHHDDNGLHPFFDRDARPLTFKETIQTRLNQWKESQGKDWSLWESWLDSCTGIVWEAGGRRFKIVPMHGDLLTAPPSNAEYLPANFAKTPGTPLTVDSTYNRDLTFDEVVTHKGWLAAVEGDSALLQEYATVAFGRMRRERAMQFWTVRQELPAHLRPLCADNLGVNCGCVGGRSMGINARFARVCPP